MLKSDQKRGFWALNSIFLTQREKKSYRVVGITPIHNINNKKRFSNCAVLVETRPNVAILWLHNKINQQIISYFRLMVEIGSQMSIFDQIRPKNYILDPVSSNILNIKSFFFWLFFFYTHLVSIISYVFPWLLMFSGIYRRIWQFPLIVKNVD